MHTRQGAFTTVPYVSCRQYEIRLSPEPELWCLRERRNWKRSSSIYSNTDHTPVPAVFPLTCTFMACADPFGLSDSGLFRSVVCKTSESGEAFVGYKLLGQPLVLSSLVDGLPLCSLHLLVPEPHRGLMVTSGEPGDPFLGVINANDQDVAFAMTNLTNDVLMFDIGGDARAIEPSHWESRDKSFYSGKHRNDKRVNQSNILWPFRTNICDRNYQSLNDSGIQTLRVKAAAQHSQSDNSSAADLAATLELHVYPKQSTPNERRFACTQWSTRDSVIVVATPALLNEATETNLVRGDALTEVSEHLQIPPEQLLSLLGIQKDAFDAVPSEIQHEALNALVNTMGPLIMMQQRAAQQQQAAEDVSAQQPLYSSAQPICSFGAQPAALTTGNTTTKQRMGGTLVEKFLFDNRSAPCTVALGVKTELVMCDETEDHDELRADLAPKVDQLMEGREQVLLDCVPSIFESEAQCVVCLNAENETAPDCILYQCGHRCVHFECAEQLRKCPMCRSLISAVLHVN